jgi:hypothetical protein
LKWRQRLRADAILPFEDPSLAREDMRKDLGIAQDEGDIGVLVGLLLCRFC